MMSDFPSQGSRDLRPNLSDSSIHVLFTASHYFLMAAAGNEREGREKEWGHFSWRTEDNRQIPLRANLVCQLG